MAVAGALALPATGNAQDTAVEPFDFGGFRNVLPAGQGETVNAMEFGAFQAGGSPPETFVDQLPLYNDLVQAAPGLTMGDLDTYFKPETFGIDGATLESTPRPGVEIYRGEHNVPKVFGATRSDSMFGAGYATAQDRLFLMDVLRHVGRGRMSEFLGPSPANLAMDRDTYRVAGYTEAELQLMIDNLDDQYGSYGTLTQQGFQDFADGVNKYIQDALTHQNGAVLPAEYATLQQVPLPWKPSDTVAIASLITGIFVVGGGGELNNCNFLHELATRYGAPGHACQVGDAAAACQVFEDFQQDDDPEKPRTSDNYYPYMVQGPVDPAAVACPDPGTLAQAVQGATMIAGDSVDGPDGPIRLFAKSRASNALLVGASRSATGHPLAVFGPQVSYFAPQILNELEVHAPGIPGDPLAPSIDARGAAFPGISLLVLLGRGRDFSWSATSAGSDLVDTIGAPLCEPGGAPATLASRSYVYKGQCLPMYQRNDVWIAKPGPGGIPDPPAFPDPSQLPSPTPDLLNDPLFLIGADEFCDFLSWKEPEAVLELARLAVATRPGFPRERLDTVLARLAHPERVAFFAIPPNQAASTEIRALAAAGRPLDGLVPDAVADLIRRRRLYAEA